MLNFGEPENPSRDNVVDYLERIFLSNMSLEDVPEERARERARELAERRVPGLLEEYREMGASPLVPQARRQAEMLGDELGRRGIEAETYVGMQYSEPFIRDAVRGARSDGVDRLIGLPVYPLCGKTTTVESLEQLREAVVEVGWDVEVGEVAGWHRHPGYLDLRADNIGGFVKNEGLDLGGEDVGLVYSAHGTPVRYLDEVRYRDYVEEVCEALSERIGVGDYVLGFQNHENRDVEWTEPETEEVVEGLVGVVESVVVEPVSFMHEQSETLSELDVELREECRELGIELHRVPVPHSDPRFAGVLADLVEGFVGGNPEMGGCSCRDSGGALCYRPSEAV